MIKKDNLDADPCELFSAPPYDERHDQRVWERIFNGTVKEEDITGEYVWTNHSTAFTPEEGAKPLTPQQQHRLLKRERVLDKLCKVQWGHF